MQVVFQYILLFALATIHVVALGNIDRLGSSGKIEENPLYVVPAPILKIMALDYDGIVSDMLLIEGLVYVGKNTQIQGNLVTLPLTKSQWQWFSSVMSVASDMDPYFQDPYYVANSFLTWDAGMVGDANALLEKGSRYRNWDWTLPFIAGFNYFFFLDDSSKSAEYLMMSYRRPGSNPILASIASKLAFRERKMEAATAFLEQILDNTTDELDRKRLILRLEAMRTIDRLEKAIGDYRNKYKRKPANLESLVEKGIISEIPMDPLGGHYHLDTSGQLRSTTEYLLIPARRINKKH